MIERVLIAAVFAAVGFGLWRTFTRWQLARAARAGMSRDPLLSGIPARARTIVYFTTPTCAPCRLQVTPTLDALKDELGEALHVIRVDATCEPDTAARWGVISVPTLFVLSADGAPRHVHNGVVSAATLRAELAAI